jgi:GNAT superfamily N-acetyltransferase
VRSEADLVAAEHRNFIGSYRSIARSSPKGGLREGPGLFAFASGHPLALFNGCVVTGGVAADELDAAIGWIRRRYVPFRVWIDVPLDGGGPSAVDRYAAVLADHSLVADEHQLPGMVLHPVPEPVPYAPGVTVRSVDPADQEDFAEHRAVWAESGLPLEIVVEVISAAFAADTDVRLFTGYLEDRPVATSIAIRSGDVSGIYGVGTIEAARRRGVGTAVTWAAVEAGRGWGCDTIVLQATEMGLPVYRAMGFRTVVSYATFAQRRPRVATREDGVDETPTG